MRWLSLFPVLLFGLACGAETIQEDDAGDSFGPAASAEPVNSFTCPDDGFVSNPVAEVSEVTGDNGTFVDHCDADGNLVTYACRVGEEWVCNEFECYDEAYPTAVVSEEVVDCLGTCSAGACASLCPRTGDTMRYVGAGGSYGHRISNDSLGEEFDCEAIAGDCTPAPDTTWTIEYYNAAHRTCMGDQQFATGVGGCTFRCFKESLDG